MIHMAPTEAEMIIKTKALRTVLMMGKPGQSMPPIL
jgi:hypothetical protein